MTRALVFVVPGDLDTRTGGYEYDRRMIEALRQRGWAVTIVRLGGEYPAPDEEARKSAVLALGAIPDGSLVVVDGLALGVLPSEATAESERLRLVALVHHPLGLETGLPASEAAHFLESEKRALASVRSVVVTSPQTARIMIERGLVTRLPAVVVPGTRRGELGRGSGGHEVRLLCVGSIVPRKGHAVLIEALSGLRSLPWTLICAGSLVRDPDTADAVQALVRERGLGNRVSFTGELLDGDLSAHYARADVFVLPTFYEGYGMVVAEAIAHGVPVIASDTGGIADIVGDDAGMVVPPGDVDALQQALRAVITDPARREAMAGGAWRVRERLPSWEDSAVAMEGVLLEAGA
ncbi:MAG: glycosyltransferase family 4 protein [Vicinamibacterales bacterium]